ncbi:hypothetical protein LSH36_368g00063 [Paralvinella palmiformis]|uniref:Uncharacterized protein n=1 Tax=Paralvinella palmiformis TaxID=53620 RepID=A0AAD9JE76_9ANNE|nr:hypothetical protein LSH36_368g00063 [Paralvinella palmiformis]
MYIVFSTVYIHKPFNTNAFPFVVSLSTLVEPIPMHTRMK